jgi:ADP-ribosylglycohydrolase
MPTQMLSRAEIVRRWGPLLPGFEAAPPGHPIAGGMPAGAVTDDTEQAVLLARLLVKGRGTIDPHELAAALTEWERAMAERGSLDLLGPSTKRAVAAILAGVPLEEAGAAGTTNGAAMRIAPVGIAVSVIDPGTRPDPAVPPDPAVLPEPAAPPDPTEPSDAAALPAHTSSSTLVDRVVMASSVTHNTGIALAGAAAVAAAVSAGVSGAAVAQATALGIQAARLAAARGHWVAGADVAARIEWAVGLAAGRVRAGGEAGATGEAEAAGLIYTLVGTSLATQESVPAAFAVLAAVPDDPWRACRLAASLGGDCDTVAAMAGAIAGACHGAGSFPPEAIAVIDAQGLGLTALAGELLALSGRSGNGA